MSEVRIEMPDGATMRIASQRRYIVATHSNREDRWYIDYRTNDLPKALARWRLECRGAVRANIVDTTERKVIR